MPSRIALVLTPATATLAIVGVVAVTALVVSATKSIRTFKRRHTDSEVKPRNPELKERIERTPIHIATYMEPVRPYELDDTQPMPAIGKHVYGYDEDGNRATHPFRHLPADSSWVSYKPEE